MPKQPLHKNCDCGKKEISFSIVKSQAYAECDISKFTEYIFSNKQNSKGKNQIFYDLGFNINNSEYLQKEFCTQALNQYLNGNYVLKKLDRFGLRLAIPIMLNEKEFFSGWMLYPERKIQNTTPFGEWTK